MHVILIKKNVKQEQNNAINRITGGVLLSPFFAQLMLEEHFFHFPLRHHFIGLMVMNRTTLLN